MIDYLKKIISEQNVIDRGNYFELIVDSNEVLSIIKELKINKDLLFDQLIDITAIDYPSSKNRFQIVYILQSLTKNKRIIVKTNLEEGIGIETITSVFKSADWYERECFDLFGIEFNNHPDLRRIMTDYGFEGYPLRKDFPLTGHNEVRYDHHEEKVIYEPVKLPQEFRNFDYESPWEGMQDSLADKEESKDEGNNERS